MMTSVKEEVVFDIVALRDDLDSGVDGLDNVIGGPLPVSPGMHSPSTNMRHEEKCTDAKEVVFDILALRDDINSGMDGSVSGLYLSLSEWISHTGGPAPVTHTMLSFGTKTHRLQNRADAKEAALNERRRTLRQSVQREATSEVALKPRRSRPCVRRQTPAVAPKRTRTRTSMQSETSEVAPRIRRCLQREKSEVAPRPTRARQSCRLPSKVCISKESASETSPEEVPIANEASPSMSRTSRAAQMQPLREVNAWHCPASDIEEELDWTCFTSDEEEELDWNCVASDQEELVVETGALSLSTTASERSFWSESKEEVCRVPAVPVLSAEDHAFSIASSVLQTAQIGEEMPAARRGSNQCCRQCGSTFGGFGDVCPPCRRNRSGSIQQCVSCSGFFQGFHPACEECA